MGISCSNMVILYYLIRNQFLEKYFDGSTRSNSDSADFSLLLDSMHIMKYFDTFSDYSALLCGNMIPNGFNFAKRSQSIYFFSFIDSTTVFAILLSPNMVSIVSKGDLSMSAK